MNLLTAESIFAFGIYVLLAYYALHTNKKSPLNRVFAAQSISFAIWCFGYAFVYISHLYNPIQVWLIDLLAAVGWCSYYAISVHFSLVITGNINRLKNKIWVYIIYLPSLIMFTSKIILFNPWSVRVYKDYLIWSNINLIITLSYILGGLFMIGKWGKKSKIGKEKKQAKVIVFSGFTSLILGIIFQNILPMLDLPTVFMAQIISLIWAFGVYFAITKYKFMSLTSNYAAEHIVSKIKDMILLLNSSELVIYSNKKVKEILGFDENNILGKNIRIIFNKPIDLGNEKFETECKTKKGELIPVEVQCTEVYDDEGDLMGTLIIINDIIENKRLQREIEERKVAEDSIRNLLDNSGQGFLKFGEDLIIEKEYSEVCTKIFNTDIGNKYFPDIIFSENKDARIYIEKKLWKIFEEKDFSAKYNYLSLLPSFASIGEWHTRLQYKLVEEKSIPKIMVILTDITKETKLENQLEEVLLKNGNSYRILIQNSMEAIIVHRDMEILYTNKSATELLGYDKVDEMLNLNFMDIIPQNLIGNIKARVIELYENNNNIISFNGNIIRKDGKLLDVENKSSLFIYEGKPTILSILHNITPYKQVKELQRNVEENKKLLSDSIEMNRLITDFFSNVSHELKTPLNVIFAAVQTLELYNGDSEGNIKLRKRYINMMEQNCYRLVKLINNLLDITRIDSGFIKPVLKKGNIISIIEETTLSVASYVESKGIKLIFDTDVEEKITACDLDKIERIMLNIISNAVKFSKKNGEILVSIKEKNDGIIVSVKDDGIGIPEDKISSIFYKFSQVDKSLSRNREGSGIGLSLVKAFVQMHRGEISVNSKLGEGTEFIIFLPTIEIDEEVINDINHEIDIERINIEFSDIYSEVDENEN